VDIIELPAQKGFSLRLLLVLLDRILSDHANPAEPLPLPGNLTLQGRQVKRRVDRDILEIVNLHVPEITRDPLPPEIKLIATPGTVKLKLVTFSLRAPEAIPERG
jgi:hypothetical protein